MMERFIWGRNQVFCLVLFFFYFFCSSFPSSSSSTNTTNLCAPSQRFALLQFKNTTKIGSKLHHRCVDPSPPKTASWTEELSGDCCAWDSVACDKYTGNVIGLDLDCSWLQGTILDNSSLFQLSHLQWLNLAYNDFMGSTISSEFGQLQELTNLNLSASSFQGLVPSQISHLSKLISLDLDNPYSYSWMSMDQQTFKSLVLNLTSLSVLNLGYMNLSSINSTSLLNLSSSITVLNLCETGIEGSFPEKIFHLSSLREIYLCGNEDLTGSLPKSNWSSPLRVLDLTSTAFSGGIPDSIGNLKFLEFLRIRAWNFTGPIPIAIGNLTRLTELELADNQFTGKIPPSICNLSFLEYLDVSNNRLSGKIPSCFGNFSSGLIILHLGKNNLEGSIPDAFVNESLLRSLDISENQLEGKLPRSLVNSTLLEIIDVGNNRLIDIFPCWLGTLKELRVLVLRSNGFHGPICLDSETISPFRILQIIDVSNNKFTGFLPRRFFEGMEAMKNVTKYEFPRIKYSINYNQDSLIMTTKVMGVSPNQVLTIFTVIDLSRNKLQGEIPEVFGDFKSLVTLNLSHNSVTGNIPSSLGNLKALESLDLSSNKLVGEIPQELVSLAFLSALNLSYNKLSGRIPQGDQFSTFGNDSFIGNLNLCGEQLTAKCSNDIDGARQQPQPSESAEFGFNWKLILLMGYGSGLLIGLSL